MPDVRTICAVCGACNDDECRVNGRCRFCHTTKPAIKQVRTEKGWVDKTDTD